MEERRRETQRRRRIEEKREGEKIERRTVKKI